MKSARSFSRNSAGLALLLVVPLVFAGCRPSAAERERSLPPPGNVIDPSGAAASSAWPPAHLPLVHLVWFTMKPDATEEDRAGLIAEIRKLSSIDVVHNLEVGRFQELGDTRAMSSLDLILSMRFASAEDYRTYQDHPVHLALKQAAGRYLAGPAVTYDYRVEPWQGAGGAR